MLGLVWARRQGHEAALAWFAYSTVPLSSGMLLCLALQVYRILQGRKRLPINARAKYVRTDTDYVAEYSIGDRIIAVILALLFSVLTGFFAFHSSTGMMISGAIFCWFVWYAVHLTRTRIRFTKSRIIAHLPWRQVISEPYENLQRIQARPGTVVLRFIGGRSLKVHAGLGDPDVVITYLKAHSAPSVALE